MRPMFDPSGHLNENEKIYLGGLRRIASPDPFNLAEGGPPSMPLEFGKKISTGGLHPPDPPIGKKNLAGGTKSNAILAIILKVGENLGFRRKSRISGKISDFRRKFKILAQILDFTANFEVHLGNFFCYVSSGANH